EHLSVQARAGGRNGVQNCVLQCGRRKVDVVRNWLDVPDTLGVGEKEQLVADNRPTDLAGILIRNRLAFRRSGQVIEKAVRVESGAVVIPGQQTVQTIAS